jgi:F-type H+-transporting ATPase subunit epsilon
MSTLNAQILTPHGSLFEGKVLGVKLPGTQGSFEVKANHAAIVSTLEKGSVLVRKDGGNITFAISGGFVEVNDNKLTLLAESAEEA